jgi:uncharacterized protein YkwD
MFIAQFNRTRIATLVLSLGVAACGGGGGSASTTTDLSNAVPSIGTSVPPVSAPDTNTPLFDSVVTKSGIAGCDVSLAPMEFSAESGFIFNEQTQEQNFLTQLNQLRCFGGLPQVVRNRLLDNAADNHAAYSLNYNTVAHEQTKGQQGYSGVTPGDRMNAALFPSVDGQPITWGEVVSRTGVSASEAFDGLTAAIYHRFVMLSPQFDEAGISLKPAANGSDMVAVVDFASTKTLTANSLIRYPAQGQQNVPVSFNSDYETPDPIAGAAFVGYPVSVQSNRGTSLTIQNFELRRVSNGALVQAYVRGTGPGADAIADSHLSNNEAFLAAKQALEPATTYQVTFVGTVKSASGAVEATRLQWSFTTAAAQPLAIAQSSKLSLGKYAPVKLAGCGSTYSWRYTAGLKASVVNSSWMQIQPTALGAQWVEVTDACGTKQRLDFTVQ